MPNTGLADVFKGAFLSTEPGQRFARAKFIQAVRSLAKGIPIKTWEEMAEANASILTLDPTMVQDNKEGSQSPEGKFFASRSKEVLSDWVKEAAPEHAAVLEGHPKFRDGVYRDLINWVGSTS